MRGDLGGKSKAISDNIIQVQPDFYTPFATISAFIHVFVAMLTAYSPDGTLMARVPRRACGIQSSEMKILATRGVRFINYGLYHQVPCSKHASGEKDSMGRSSGP